MQSKFGPETWNMVAKRIREQNWHLDNNRTPGLQVRGALAKLASDFARTFKRDNGDFDPLHFLDRCSPDVDRMPLSELWDS